MASLSENPLRVLKLKEWLTTLPVVGCFIERKPVEGTET